VVSSLSCWRRVCVICGLVCSGAFCRAICIRVWMIFWVVVMWVFFGLQFCL